MRGLKLLTTVAALGLLYLVGIAPAALAAPEWSIRTESISHVQPGESIKYFIIPKNIGDQTADKTETVVVRLPGGITGVSFDGKLTGFANRWTCTDPSGATTITCTRVSAASFTPGREIGFTLTAAVAEDASGVLIGNFEISGGGAPTSASVDDPVSVVLSLPGFGVDAFDGAVSDGENGQFTQAAGTPYESSTMIRFNTIVHPYGQPWPAAPPHDVAVSLPPGLIGNPYVAATCTTEQLVLAPDTFGPSCPPASQVGLMTVVSSPPGAALGRLVDLPIYRMVAPPRTAARFGVNAFGAYVFFNAKVRSGDYGVTVTAYNASEGLAVVGSEVTFWGVPAGPAHDAERACPGQVRPAGGGPSCASDASEKPFLRNPTSCMPDGVGLVTSLRTDSWFDIGDFKTASFESHLPPGLDTEPDPSQWGEPQGTTDCDEVPFGPDVSIRPTTRMAASPTGLVVDLTLPQTDDPEAIGTSDLKKALVALPEGMTVNPATAAGLSGCTLDQANLDSTESVDCPESSKIGTVEIDTPLLDHQISGAVYQAAQGDNPFGSLLALYIVADDPESGVVLKLPGKIEPAASGQLITTFDSQPQLPFEHLHLELKSGARAPLVTPATCGTKTATADFSPWARPEEVVHLESSFQITSGPNGAPCANSDAERPFDPKLDAGTLNPQAGAKSPFVLNLSRQDGEQLLTGIEAMLPEGSSAVLKGIPYCPESALTGFPSATGTGAIQLASPSCPAASQVGTVDTGAGAGPLPFHVGGKAYLAGPYKGAPLSLAIFVPALAGPFDLGTVMVRTALHVDPATAQITARSDALPTILAGIPLDIRSVDVSLDRPNFTINPTSCEEMSVDATLTSDLGKTATPSNRYQLLGCGDLGFKPRLRMRLFGPTHRGAHPRLRAVLTMPQRNQANIARAAVTLPGTELLENSHIRTVCTRVKYAADECPAASIYGYARALSPLLDEPLKGPVYLRSSNHTLPDLVASLDGQVHIDLVGRIDSVNGRIRNTFEAVPDAPVSKFVLTMQGGRKGLLVNSSGICDRPQHAIAKFDGQNGKIHDIHPRVRAGCGAERRAKRR